MNFQQFLPGWGPFHHVLHVLQAAFTRADPKSAKMTDNLTVFFELLGSASIKAVGRMLMKLATDGNLINILCANLLYKDMCSLFLITVWLCNFLTKKYWHQCCSQNVQELFV